MSEFALEPELDHLVAACDVARRQPPMLAGDDDLDVALQVMRESDEDTIAVVDDREEMKFLGCVREGRVMAAYNKALLDYRRDERG